jgi:AraC-like DNA-binding protein
MNLKCFVPFVCWILVFFPFCIQGQDTTSWASEKMMAIQKAEENQRLDRLSYPEHLFESQVWQPPGTENVPPESIPIWAYALGILFFILLAAFAVRFYIRNRHRVQRQKLIWDKLAALKTQTISEKEEGTWVPIAKQVLEHLSWEILPKTSIQIQRSSAEHATGLELVLENDKKSSELSIALSQVLAGHPGSTLQVDTKDLSQLRYLFTIPQDSDHVYPLETAENSFNLMAQGAPIKGMDRDFLVKANELVSEKMGEAEFNAEAFQKEMGMSKTHFYRKVQELTHQSPGQYIRTMRLAKARQLLEAGEGNVSEIAYEVGFNNLSYFSRCFRNEFGILPSEVS